MVTASAVAPVRDSGSPLQAVIAASVASARADDARDQERKDFDMART